MQLWKVPADMCILNADMCILNASFQVSSNRSHSHTVFFADICTLNPSWNFLSGPISQQGFLISTFNVVDYHVDTGRWTIFWSLTRAEYACTWRAPISETGIALLKDDFDRLIGDRMHYDMKDAFANPAKWSLIKPF